MQPRPGAPVPFGKYLLVEKIASGGMAEVFRAVLRGTAGFEKTVALKRILPVFGEEAEFVTLFQDEARIASTLTHANIAQVFELGEVDGTYYLTLELVDGLDLARLLARLRAAGQPMPLASAVFIVAEAARGLAYAHEKRGAGGQLLGIVHRDVSPPNLLISRDGEVKVADFGIAKAAGKVHKTETGALMGKLRYMSPEQLAADPGVVLDARSDIFSLGVILYELLTGGPIFQGAESLRLAELIRSGEIPPPSSRNPEVTPALDQITMRALARRRDERYPRAAELARDLAVHLTQYAPGFTREDLGALVASLAPAGGHDAPATPGVSQEDAAPAAATVPASPAATRQARPSPSGESLPPGSRRRRSPAAWLGALLLLIISASGAMVLVRFFLPGPRAEMADARRLVLTPPASDAGGDAEPPPSAPFTLLASVSTDEKRALAAAVDQHLVTRRGIAAGDYAAYLTGLDFALAALVVDGNGHGLPPPAPPPPVTAALARFNAEAPVAATVDYLRRTGELPPMVRDAALAFVRRHGAVQPDETPLPGGVLPPYSAAALAVWLEPASPTRLAELAYANDVLGRWCEPPPPPARHFAPLLCERQPLIDALRAGDRRDATAAALERWQVAQEELQAEQGALRIERIGYPPTARPGVVTLELELNAEISGATLVAGGVPETPLARLEGQPGWSAPVPARIVAPVLRIDGVEGLLRVPAPPWGAR